MTVILKYRDLKPKALVKCMECGTTGPEKFMGHVGHDAWKCVYCLFKKNNNATREDR